MVKVNVRVKVNVWAESGQECQSLHSDAHLAVINSSAEQSEIETLISATDRQSTFLIINLQSYDVIALAI